MIKVIFFDVGGVYANSGGKTTMERMAERFGIEKTEIIRKLDDISKDFHTGKLDNETFFANASERLNVPASEISKLYTGHFVFEINQPLHEIILKLKRNGYLIATITDTNPFHLEVHLERETYKVFDKVFDSVRCGAWKKDGELYQIALREMGVEPGETVMIDNDDYKLVEARNMGMNAILFVGIDDLLEKLHALGVKI